MESALESLLPRNWAICISEATRNDLCNRLPALPANHVFVTSLAASESFHPCGDAAFCAATRAKYQIPQNPYFLSLSTLEPRKNMEHLVRCFAALTQEPAMRDFNLVLVGNKGWKYEALLEEIERNTAARGRVILTGFVDDEDLAALYSGAVAFVFPSLYEGFGLPPLEAMQCGIPVIASNTSALPEVVGDAGILVSPSDADALCAAMISLANQPAQREELSRRSLQQAARFSWERCVAQTMAAYRFAVASQGRS